MRNYLENPEYCNFFDTLDDVLSSYQISDIGGLPLYMHYDGDSYEGYSKCWVDRGGQLMYNRAGHCSCYGLEGSWDPEEYIPGQLLRLDYEEKPDQAFIEWVLATYNKEGKRIVG